MPSEIVGQNINVVPSVQVFSIPDPEDLVQPSITQPIQPAEPMTTTQSRRRRRQSAPMSAEMGRTAVVESSRLRAEATQRISSDLENIGNVLSRIAATLDSINNRLPFPQMSNELSSSREAMLQFKILGSPRRMRL